jgi:hypothetical protein
MLAIVLIASVVLLSALSLALALRYRKLMQQWGRDEVKDSSYTGTMLNRER